jgi:NADH-quinone oxidoreductase subunit L
MNLGIPSNIFAYFMYSLIVLLPLFAALVISFWGYRLGIKGTVIINTLALATAALLSYHCFWTVGLVETPIYIPLYTWIDSGLFTAEWLIQIDNLTLTMFLLVTTVSTLVYVYAVSYLLHDPHLIRFSAYIAYFVFSMLALVTANNFIQLFFGWEGVGICSYLLISFWFTRIQANKAAIKAVLFNKVGDVALLFAIAALFAVFQAIDFGTVFALAPFYETSTFFIGNVEITVLGVICFFLFIGAVGKSAQLGLHLWLPDAMEG